MENDVLDFFVGRTGCAGIDVLCFDAFFGHVEKLNAERRESIGRINDLKHIHHLA